MKSIVSYISIHCDIDHETFQSFAEGLVAGDHMIRNVTLLKDTVIVDVYPVKGEKKVLGLRYLPKVSGQHENSKKSYRNGIGSCRPPRPGSRWHRDCKIGFHFLDS